MRCEVCELYKRADRLRYDKKIKTLLLENKGIFKVVYRKFCKKHKKEVNDAFLAESI